MNIFISITRTAATVSALLIVAAGGYTLVSEPLATWTSISLAVSLLLLAAAAVFSIRSKDSYFSLAAFLYATVLVGRLFSTLRPAELGAGALSKLDPLLVGETGPGVASITYLTYALSVFIGILLIRLTMNNTASKTVNSLGNNVAPPSQTEWAMTYLRLYVGLMFIAHYSGHVLAGPVQFDVFASYFAGVGLHIGAPMVVLAGLIEIAVSIGLVFGLMTRLASVGAALYLFFATLWGDHFTAGYIWVLPKGGWEFSALWVAVIIAFAATGGGKISVDSALHGLVPKRFKRLFA